MGVLARAMRELSRPNFADGSFAMAGDNYPFGPLVRSVRTLRQPSPLKSTTIDPLCVSLRI